MLPGVSLFGKGTDIVNPQRYVHTFTMSADRISNGLKMNDTETDRKREPQHALSGCP